MFYDIFEDLCRMKGVSPNKACIEMGLSRSVAAKWKNTKTKPSADVLPKIADYFNVTLDYLLTGEEVKEKTPTLTKKDERDVNDDDIKFALFGNSEIDDDLLDEVKRFADFAKERRYGKSD